MSDVIKSLIDHTALKSDTTKEEVSTLCVEAKEYHFAAVCVNPFWVKYAKEQLENSKVNVCTVIGFPLGANSTEIKVNETNQAIEDGATEIDMVINIGSLKGKDDAGVLHDIESVVNAAKSKAIVKVIIETALLTEEEKARACQLSVQGGADYVKTSTGFVGGGATEEDILLMREQVGPDIGIKASGGIRDREKAELMIKAGANRIGTSSGVTIVSVV